MQASDRFQQALSAFTKARARLHDVLQQDENEFIRDAVIQRFEFTFETAWKAAYRWLRDRGEAVNESAHSVLPLALANGLILDVSGWDEMRLRRNQTSHTYDEGLAMDVSAFVRARAPALFDELLQQLHNRANE